MCSLAAGPCSPPPPLLQYGQGSLTADVGTDVVRVGFITSKARIGVATELDPSFHRMVADGIVGMGLVGLSSITKPPMFQAAVAQVRVLSVCVMCACVVAVVVILMCICAFQHVGGYVLAVVGRVWRAGPSSITQLWRRCGCGVCHVYVCTCACVYVCMCLCFRGGGLT